jgi:hypothetical protein
MVTGKPPRSRTTGPMCGLDFDAVRGSLRSIIQSIAVIGGVATLSGLTIAGVKAGSSNSLFNTENLVKWAKTMTPEELMKLYICIALDVGGAAPEFLLPGLPGESLDVVWAPLYAYALFRKLSSSSV